MQVDGSKVEKAEAHIESSNGPMVGSERSVGVCSKPVPVLVRMLSCVLSRVFINDNRVQRKKSVVVIIFPLFSMRHDSTIHQHCPCPFLCFVQPTAMGRGSWVVGGRGWSWVLFLSPR